MPKVQNQTTQIHQCSFEAKILDTNAAVKFSCKMFVAWKNMSNKTFCKTFNDNVTVQNGVATFNENLSFQTYMLFDKATQKYLKKETSLCLLLISTRKPDEQKLVGRVVVDLSQILNNGAFSQFADYKLSFCSIKDATLTFNVVSLRTVKTDMKPMGLDMDQFSDISRTLNQSQSSNNEDLVAYKKLTKEIGGSQTDKIKSLQKIEKEQDMRTSVQKALSSPRNERESEIKVQRAESIQVLTDLRPKQNKAQLQNIPIRIRQEVVYQTPEILQLKFQNKKLENENEKLIEIIDQVNAELAQQKAEVEKWRRMYEQLEAHALQTDTEKNDVIQELLTQAQDLTRKHNQLESKLKTANSGNVEVEKLTEKLTKLTRQYEESERARLDNQSELLQVRYELSEVKSERQIIDNEIKAKDDEILRLYEQIQGFRGGRIEQQDGQILQKKVQQLETQLKVLEGQFSKIDKERQSLQKKIQQLQKQNANLKSATNTNATSLQINHTIDINQHLRMLEQKQTQINNLNAEIQRREQMTRNQFEVFNKQNEKCVQINNKLQQKIGQSNVELQSVNKFSKSITEQLESSKKAIQNLEQEVETKSKQLQSKSKQIQFLSGSLVQKQWQIKLKFQQINRLREQINKIKSQKQRVLSQVKNNAVYIEKLEQKLNEDQINKKNIENENKYYKNKLEEYKASVGRLEKEGEAYKEKLNALSAESANKMKKIQKSATDKDSTIQAKEKQISQLKSKLETQTTKIRQLEERLTRFAEKEVKMRENILILEEESRKIYDIVVDKEENEELQTKQMEEKDLEIENLRNQLREKNTFLQIANEQLAQYKRQLFEMKKQAINSRSPTQSISNGVEEKVENDEGSLRLQQLLNLNNERISELERQIRSKEYEKSKQIESLMVKINLLQKQVENEKGRILNLEQQRNELRTQKIQLNSKVEILQSSQKTINDLKQQLKGKNMEIQMLQKQVQHTQGEIRSRKEQAIVAPPNTPLLPIVQQKEAYERTIKELKRENEMIQTQLTTQEQNISHLQEELQKANHEISLLKRQLEDVEVEKMSLELGNQFKTTSSKQKQENRRDNNLISNVFTSQIIQACRSLQKILRQRSQKDKTESVIELMMSKNAVLQQYLNKITEQRGTIQQNARRISMQFQKVKSNILKGQRQYKDKTQLLSYLKPCEVKIKTLVEMSEKLFENQIQIENY